jgi:hypothetical protein
VSSDAQCVARRSHSGRRRLGRGVDAQRRGDDRRRNGPGAAVRCRLAFAHAGVEGNRARRDRRAAIARLGRVALLFIALRCRWRVVMRMVIGCRYNGCRRARGRRVRSTCSIGSHHIQVEQRERQHGGNSVSDHHAAESSVAR